VEWGRGVGRERALTKMIFKEKINLVERKSTVYFPCQVLYNLICIDHLSPSRCKVWYVTGASRTMYIKYYISLCTRDRHLTSSLIDKQTEESGRRSSREQVGGRELTEIDNFLMDFTQYLVYYDVLFKSTCDRIFFLLQCLKMLHLKI